MREVNKIVKKRTGWVGIDPGKSGALCFLGMDDTILFKDWPKKGVLTTFFTELNQFFSDFSIIFAVLEKVHSMPQQGVASMFTFGANYGMWRAVLLMTKTPHALVAPNVWSKGLFSKEDGISTKERSVNAASRLYPNAELTGPKGGILDGRSDALLMAHYAKTFKGMDNADKAIA